MRISDWSSDVCSSDLKPAPVGTIIRNPAYAKLLRDLAARGADAFYTGANAQAIVKAVTQAPRNRSKMTLADLAAYQAKERPAVCTTYRVYKVCGMASPSSGATTVFGILGILEASDMKAMGKDNVMSCQHRKSDVQGKSVPGSVALGERLTL